MAIKHPRWYYDKYSEVFSRGTRYDHEIDLVCGIVDLNGCPVQEIGAGTGEHAIRILGQDPVLLELVDDDPVAVSLLRTRFRTARNVHVVMADGFKRKSRRNYDAVIAMYSIILQNLTDTVSLRARIRGLTERLTPRGTAFFEAIDAQVSKRIYPPGLVNTIHESQGDYVTVRSEYSDRYYEVIYGGRIGGRPIRYEVTMLSLDQQQLCSLLSEVEQTEFGVVPLDGDGRRLLAYVRRKRPTSTTFAGLPYAR